MIRGGGDLGSGAAYRLSKSGLPIIISELAKPVCVRRLVCYSNAVYENHVVIEGIEAHLVQGKDEAVALAQNGKIAVMIDPDAKIRHELHFPVIVDARMTKQPPDMHLTAADLVVGLGPGFTAGENCHAVVETNRGSRLGRICWNGKAEEDTGLPESVASRQADRVLRAPLDGKMLERSSIGSKVKQGEIVAEVEGIPVQARFDGVIRGLLKSGLPVKKGMKIGDIDPRNDPELCKLISDKALAIGGGVLEAVLSREDIRCQFYGTRPC